MFQWMQMWNFSMAPENADHENFCYVNLLPVLIDPASVLSAL